GFKSPAAGKTGTTNDKRDAWFIGFTPQTLALTWIGFDDNKETGLSGGEAAVPIWTRYMNAVTAGQLKNDFAVPAGITFAQVDETSGGLATPQCPKNAIVNEAFKAGMEPQGPCPLHSVGVPAMPTGVDEFGNPIALDTTGTTGGEIPSTPDSVTLTGGYGHPEPAIPPPPPTPMPAPMPMPQPQPSTPPESTNTSPPPESTNTSSTTSTNPP
ncbi:MAG TPA: hypothetical protein VJ032_14030, partial [Thermoanaerobaculia bacterium]|nr:hypothetical protein [Thermoanaerobaculia bacterium]